MKIGAVLFLLNIAGPVGDYGFGAIAVCADEKTSRGGDMIRLAEKYGLAGVLAIAALAGTIGAAHALVITQTVDWNFSVTHSKAANEARGTACGMPGFDRCDTIRRFDSTLGTLDRVVLSIRDGIMESSAGAQFETDVLLVNGGQGLLGMGVNFAFPGLDVDRGVPDRTDTCIGVRTITTPARCRTGLALRDNALNDVNRTYEDPSILALYTAPPGRVRYSITQYAVAGVREIGERDFRILDFEARIDSRGTISVAYDYTPFSSTVVTEPETLALFGAGLAGLGALRRRRAKA